MSILLGTMGIKTPPIKAVFASVPTRGRSAVELVGVEPTFRNSSLIGEK